MENSKVYQLIAFACCSAINDNLNYIYYTYNRYNKKLNNINNNQFIIKLNRNIQEITKDLFK
ncbi:hypothetical protein H9660_00395 [Clostridium sp. Sa3CUN1]|uniref:Uncharacterized protein n=1 Tax=Clostridium gallinarum TaxID=2762246 RepID=A0ABR8PZK0_9CLOT|nr:hypothetical protein [Clostridium gallinarum]MBD7913596.1 hypothetical protein [Clostridium gallinarum]